MSREQFDNLEIDSRVELIISGTVTRVLGVDFDDAQFMDETGAWHSYEDAELVSA